MRCVSHFQWTLCVELALRRVWRWFTRVQAGTLCYYLRSGKPFDNQEKTKWQRKTYLPRKSLLG